MEYNRQEPMTTNTARESVAVDVGLRAYMLQVFNLMASALALTGIAALVFAKFAVADMSAGQLALTSLGQAVYLSPLKWVVMFAPLGIVFYLSARVNSLSTSAAQGWFWAFAVVMGISMSSIFLVYTGTSIARTFFITAATFGGMSLYGYTTKRDLTGMGSFLMMGLIGLILASIVNIFLKSSALEFAVSAVGILIFTGLTAYDTQKLKAIYYSVAGNTDAIRKSAIMGALNLYLDFINLFMMLLRFFGDRR